MIHSLQYKLPVLVPTTRSTAAVLQNYTTFTWCLRCYLIKWLEWNQPVLQIVRTGLIESHLKEVRNINQGWYLISYAVRINVGQTSCLRSYFCICLISGSFLHIHNTVFQYTKERVASFYLVLDTGRWLLAERNGENFIFPVCVSVLVCHVYLFELDFI